METSTQVAARHARYTNTSRHHYIATHHDRYLNQSILAHNAHTVEENTRHLVCGYICGATVVIVFLLVYALKGYRAFQEEVGVSVEPSWGFVTLDCRAT